MDRVALLNKTAGWLSRFKRKHPDEVAETISKEELQNLQRQIQEEADRRSFFNFLENARNDDLAQHTMFESMLPPSTFNMMF